MGRIHIERTGGFAGFGLPGSHVQSRGEMALSALSPADRAAVDALFDRKGGAESSMPDGFRYRITRQTAAGAQTIDVPESKVPAALKDSVKDVLK
ncbi:MAG: protealysin inhibitor emfourin [Vicinamibacterales bacterium]